MESMPEGPRLFSGNKSVSEDVFLAVVPCKDERMVALTRTTCLSIFSERGGLRLPGYPVTCHDRDIRCLAADPRGGKGGVVATGSLDGTVQVHFVPFLRGLSHHRLRGHTSGVSCICFCRNRLLSADCKGVLVVWDPLSGSQIQTVQGHQDSIQALDTTADRVISGSLDGSVCLWGWGRDGHIALVLRLDGMCSPFKLTVSGRYAAFTSSACPNIEFLAPTSVDVGSGSAADIYSAVKGSKTFPGCEVDSNAQPNQEEGHDWTRGARQWGAGVTVVDVLNGVGKRILTGHHRTQHLVMGGSMCALAVVASDNLDNDSEEFNNDLGIQEGIQDTSYPLKNFSSSPRVYLVTPLRLGRILCHCYKACLGLPCKHGEEPQVGQGPQAGAGCSFTRGERVAGCQGCGEVRDDWRQEQITKGWVDLQGSPGAHGNGLGQGALCTCAAVSGQVVFLGYDTGEVSAHHVLDGRYLYSLVTRGPPVHILPDKDSLLVYCLSGIVARWWWQGAQGSHCSSPVRKYDVKDSKLAQIH
ncbi:unnamed protein product [Discosporangium mesarthrocarpum]